MISLIWGGLVVGTAYGLLALSISFLYRVTGVINFAHGELFTLGAFLTYAGRTQWELPWPAVVLIALAGCAVAAALVDLVAVRPVWRRIGRHSHSTLLTTFGVALLLQTAFSHIWGTFDLQGPSIASTELVRIGAWSFTTQELTLVVVGIAAVVSLETLSRRLTFFKVAEAVSERPKVAELVGVNTSIITTVAWALSGILAGIGGLLYTPLAVLNSYSGFFLLILAFATMIIGGLGKPLGAMIAGYILGVYQSVLGAWIPGGYLLAATYAAVVFVLVARPKGLFVRSAVGRA